MIYFLIITITLWLLVREFNKDKRKINRKNNLFRILSKLPEKPFLRRFFYDKSKKRYIKLDKSLKEAGLKITVWQFQALRYLFVIILIVLGFLIGVTNFYFTIQENLPAEFSIQKIILVGIILGIILFKLGLYFLIEWKKGRTYKELLMLQTYTIVMLKTGSNVKSILVSLTERSNIFKPYFEEALKKYSKNPTEALNNLKEKISNPQFQKIIIALQQVLNNDKSLSVLYLTTNRQFDKELIKIRQKELVGNRQIIGFIIILAPLLITLMVVGFPWYKMIMENFKILS